MSGKCFLCKYCDRSEEVCSLRGPIKDMFYGYCTRFESAAVTKHLSAKKSQPTVPAKEPEGTRTEQEQKEEEKDVVPDISSYNKGKVLYWYTDKSEPCSWKLLYSLSKQLKDRSVSKAEVESGSLYGKEYKGLIFKKTVRKQGVKVISQEGKETYYNSLDTCAANMGYSTKTISGKIHNITKDSYGNMYEFYMYDEDIPYIKAVSYYY